MVFEMERVDKKTNLLKERNRTIQVKNMMNYESSAINLIQKAQTLGYLDTSMTMKCKECNAVFPKEYVFCPKCNSDKSFLELNPEIKY